MSTYRSLLVKAEQKDTLSNEAGKNGTKIFKYMKPFSDDVLYRHCVDGHNNMPLRDIN